MSAQKYKYTNISELTTNPCDVNFYGIIYDATFPLHEEPNNYICTLKIIDTDINCKNNPNTLNNDCINLIIKSNQKESLPYVHCVGDIIRVHRGLYVRIIKFIFLKFSKKNYFTNHIFPNISFFNNF